MPDYTKVALVTGGSRGIGAAICRKLAAERFAVIVNFRRRRDAAEEVVRTIHANGGEAIALRGDVAEAAQRARLANQSLAWHGHLDCLVNNAGIAPPRRVDILELDEAEVRAVLEINLLGAFFLTQRLAGHMLAQENSPAFRSIIFTSSVSAAFASVDRAAYCIAKAGLSMTSKLFAARLAQAGIGVYEIRPGLIATDMTAPVREHYEKRLEAGLQPIARLGTPEEVATVVAAVARGDHAYATGTTLYADGGLHLRRL